MHLRTSFNGFYRLILILSLTILVSNIFMGTFTYGNVKNQIYPDVSGLMAVLPVTDKLFFSNGQASQLFSELASDQISWALDNITTRYNFKPGKVSSNIRFVDSLGSTESSALISSKPFVSAPSQTALTSAYVYPLKPSLNRRYFVDQNNAPFFINGDTPWSLIGQVSNEDAEFYLQDAASKGINSIIVTLTESFYADNAPANYYGIQPFTTLNKFTTPNEAYFAHADWVINKAAQYGLQVILAPNYLGCCGDGWWDELLNNNSVSDAAWYGNYIGNRYKNFPNLMYVWGDDTNPCGYNSTATNCAQKDKIRAMAQAVFAADPNHLHTFHASPEFSARDIFDPSTDPWLTANITYTYQPVQIKSLQDYNRSPIMPFFLFESHYERDWNNAPPIQTRRQAYVAVLSGAAGHQFGNNPIWHMNGKPGDTTNTWKLHLNDEGRSSLQYIRALFESRAWYNLVPDQSHAVVISGYGSATGSDYVGAARTSDGATFIAYIPFQKQITVDKTKISGTTINAWWFNPRDGTAQLIGIFAATGNQDFTPPTNEDWILVLDNASLNFPPPGGGTVSSPIISGNAGMTGVTLSYVDGVVKTMTADGSGNYSFGVSPGWSGTVTPYRAGYSFSPANRTYVYVTSNQTAQNYIATSVSSAPNTTGVFRPSNGLLYLKNKNETGIADIAINYGLGGDYPVTGDWDGNGTATIGVYRNASFYLRNSNTLGFADLVFAFGQPGDQPVAGDWNGDGKDTIGIYRPSTGQFLLRDSNAAGAADYSFYLGNVGDVGIAGDWNGDGKDTTGVFRPSNGVIFLKNTNVTGFADIALNYGLPGDQPVTGDWNGDGIDTIGVYRNGQFLLRNSNAVGFADISFYLGNPGDMPIAGDWDGLP